MRIKDLARKAQYWCGYWPLTVVVGLAALVFDWRRRRRKSGGQMRILVIMIEHIGDIIVSAPFLRALRMAQPAAHITVVTSKSTWTLLEHCPLIDELIVADGNAGWLGNLLRAVKLGRRLRALNADAVIVPKDAPNEDFNELICLLAGCPQRISRVRPQLVYRIKPLKFPPFYDRIVVDDKVRHEVDQRLRLARLFGDFPEPSGLEAWLTPDDLGFADRFLSGIGGTAGAPLITIGLGASAAGRCWPLERYARVIEHLGREYGITALAIIGPSEVEDAKELQRITRYPVHYAPSSTIRQSITLIRRSALFIGNDSGPMHMAASVGVPVVEISTHPQGGTSWSINCPDRFGAYGVPARILRPVPLDPRCMNGCVSGFVPHCITNITADMVVEAASELLDERLRPEPERIGADEVR